MKITIELTEAEVKGIKAYLLEVDGVKAGKAEVSEFISGIATGVIHAPQEAVSDYINRFEALRIGQMYYQPPSIKD
jgi:hypothetical protein